MLACLARYVVAGGLAAVVDVFIFWLLVQAGLNAAAAALLSFGLAMLVNYRISAGFVFRARHSWRGLLMFAAAAATGCLCNIAMTLLAMAQFGLAPAAAKLAGIGSAFGLNFLLNRKLVFASK